jgi:hypothetical protein
MTEMNDDMTAFVTGSIILTLLMLFSIQVTLIDTNHKLSIIEKVLNHRYDQDNQDDETESTASVSESEDENVVTEDEMEESAVNGASQTEPQVVH